MTKETLKIIGWTALAVATFFLWKVSHSPSPSKQTNSKPSQLVRTVEPMHKTNSSGGGDRILFRKSKNQLRNNIITVAKASEGNVESNLRISSVMRMDDPAERAPILLGLLKNMAPENFQHMADDFRRLGLWSRSSEYNEMLRAWAKVDPYGALAHAQSSSACHNSENVILYYWVKYSPNAAIEWAEANYQGKKVNPYMVGIIGGLAKTDLNTATNMLEQMPFSEKRREALQHLVNTVAERGNQEALAWLDTISDKKLKLGATTRLVSNLSRRDPTSVASWVSDLEDKAIRESSFKVLTYFWAQKDMTEAKEWVSSLDNVNKTAAALGMIREYAKQDAPAAADWVNSMKEAEGYQELLLSFIWSTAFSKNPEVPLSQVSKIQSEATQSIVYARTLGKWASKDPMAVQKWLDKNEIPKDIQQFTQERIKKALGGLKDSVSNPASKDDT